MNWSLVGWNVLYHSLRVSGLGTAWLAGRLLNATITVHQKVAAHTPINIHRQP